MCDGSYEYHMTYDFPYVLGCFAGLYESSGLRPVHATKILNAELALYHLFWIQKTHRRFYSCKIVPEFNEKMQCSRTY